MLSVRPLIPSVQFINNSVFQLLPLPLKKSITTGICLFILLLQSTAQDNALVTLKNQFNQYQQQQLQEKIFVHTDKNFYLAGEILWFKLYDMDASFHQPLGLSKVAYVEILDTAHKALLQAKIALTEGKGSGSFYLPVTLHSGHFILRAYTNWMKNYSADYFFEKTITIINSQKPLEPITHASSRQLTARFFPEGGNLVNNIQSKVGFIITDENGKGVENCTGAVVNDKKDTLVKFTSAKFGMGSFNFTASSTQTYHVFITDDKAARYTAALPSVYEKGYVMQVAENNGQLNVTVQSNLAAGEEIYLFGHTRQSIKIAEKAVLVNGSAQFTVDKNKLGDGISNLTVFNHLKQPVCERLCFKYPEKKLTIEAVTNAPDYAIRKKINIAITTGNDKKMQPADMSMAVYRLDSLQHIDDNDITSYLWLTSDLKGVIESPAYYFSNRGKETEEALDNLLLTQGWRRFSWNNILENKPELFTYAPEYQGHIITGKTVNSKTGEPANDIESYLSIPGTRTQFEASHSDTLGNVKFELKNMFGSSEIIVQTDPTQDSLYRVDINSPFSEKYSNRQLPAFNFPSKNSGSLLNQSISMQVQNIYLTDKLKQFTFPLIDSNAFFTKPDAIYLLDNYTRFTTMEEVMREYVQLMMVRRRNGVFHLPVFNIPANEPFETDPLILLDGVPMFNTNKLMSYDPLKIRKLEVVNGKYIYGDTYYDGILSYTTYKGDLTGFELDPHATVIDYEGLQLQREFYTPLYENEQQIASRMPDFRNVLYWSPDIVTTETGKQQVSFYSSDLTGHYVAVIQGITTNGSCGSKLVTFDVK